MLPRASPDPTTAPRPSSHSPAPRHPVSTPPPWPASFFSVPGGAWERGGGARSELVLRLITPRPSSVLPSRAGDSVCTSSATSAP